MPTYKVTDPTTGRTVSLTGDSPPNESELNDIFSKLPGKKSQGPGFLQKAAQVATFPMRAMRPYPVALANLLKGEGPSTSLARGALSLSPQFKPKGTAETLGTIAGESAPFFALGGPLGTGGRMARIGKAALAGGGLSALTQTAEEGKPTLGRTATTAVLAATPTAALEAVKGIYPSIAGKFTKSPAEAYRGLTTTFKQRFPGTSQTIESASSRVTPLLKQAYEMVNKRLQGRKEYMGMLMSPSEAIEEAAATRGEPRTVGRIASEFKDVQKRSAPIIQKRIESQLLGPTGKPLTKVVTERGISPGEKLRRLNDFARDINDTTKGSYTTDVFQLKQTIDDTARKTGKTSYQIYQKFLRQWGHLKDIQDDLGRNLSDPDAAGSEIENLVRKTIEKPEKISGGEERKLEAVRRLEKVTGKSIIEPLRNEILSSYTNVQLSEYVPKGMLGKLLLIKYWPEGIASFVLGSPKAMGRVAQALYNEPGPIARATRGVAPYISSKILQASR